MEKAASTITEQLPIEGKTKELTETAIKSGDFKGTLNNEVSAKKQTAIDNLKAPIVAPIDEAKQQVKDKVELKKQTLEDKAKQNAKNLVGKDEPVLSDEEELAAELNAEAATLNSTNTKATPAFNLKPLSKLKFV
ncbi:MAG: hypothetical protein U5L01_09900 [Rheinheimera sp.]|nr:hypothetical protein [Rheinheimera sp.]